MAVSGSSQRMMQSLILDAQTLLYGRARQILKLSPLPAGHIGEALDIIDPVSMVESYTIWGGIPRYWELAAPFKEKIKKAVIALVLDPMGVLHDEPRRLLLEEMPSAISLRPLLDVMGMGTHRLSEMAARVGQPVTSLTRPLLRLQELGLVVREIPFGESEKPSKRVLYKIADPFFRFWFCVVAAQRSPLVDAGETLYQTLLKQALPGLYAQAWEELCRHVIPKLGDPSWMPSKRFWHGKGPEWDVVSQSVDKQKLLLGEAKWSRSTLSTAFIEKTAQHLMEKGSPPLKNKKYRSIDYIIFVPRKPCQKAQLPANVRLVDAAEVMNILKDA